MKGKFYHTQVEDNTMMREDNYCVRVIVFVEVISPIFTGTFSSV